MFLGGFVKTLRKKMVAAGIRGLLGLALAYGLVGCGSSPQSPEIQGETALPAGNGPAPQAASEAEPAPVARKLPKGVVRFENKTTFSIHELYYASRGSFDWQANELADKEPLQPGDSIEFTVAAAYQDGLLDFCVVTVEYILNAPAELPFLVMKRSGDIIVTDNDLEQDTSIALPADRLWE
jgi:hypothetical protein